MQPRRRRRLIIVALVLLVLLWPGMVPEQRDLAFRAMPENSLFVSEHLNLPGVWRERFSNPLLVRTLQGAGVDKVDEWSEDPGTIWIVRLVSGKRSLIGWTPALGPSGGPCWTGASRAGFRGPLLRAMLLVRWVPGLGRLGTTERGTRYLETVSERKRARGKTGPRIGFILRNNILLAAMGDDPDAVHDLDQRLTSRAPLAPIFAGDTKPWKSTGCAPHRAWIAPGFSPVPLPFDHPAALRLTYFAADRIGLNMALPLPEDSPATPVRKGLTASCAAADALAADAACAMLLMPGTVAQETLLELLPTLRDTWRTPVGDKSAALYLTTQTLGGRIFGLAVPAITLLYPEPPAAPDAVPQAIEAVSKAISLKLRTRQAENGPEGRLLVDWLGHSKHIRLVPEDCVAIETHPSWLTLCSSAASLDAQRRRSVPDGGSAWRAALESQLDASDGQLDAFVWIDLNRTLHELRQIYAVYRLATSLGALRVTSQEAAVMTQTHLLLETLAIDGSLAITWRQDARHMRIGVELSAATNDIVN